MMTFALVLGLGACATGGDDSNSQVSDALRKKLKSGDCGCGGGFMAESYCDTFGAPWTWNGSACVWFAKDGSVGAETCAAVEAKHHGDASGSDIYNLGLTCTYAE